MNLLRFSSLMLALLIAAGCASPKPKIKVAQPIKTTASVPKAVPAPKPATPIVTVDTSLTARVISYNQAAQYVVLGFPSSNLPSLNETLFLYRNGLKTAQLKVTGPKSDNNIVADVITGEVQVGDEVRDQ